MSRIQIVVLDKTGTLTVGAPVVTDLKFVSSLSSEGSLLQTAASLSHASTHPLSRAIVQAAEERKVSFVPVRDVKTVAGKGLQGLLENELVLVGSAKLFADHNWSLETMLITGEQLAEQGRSLTYVGRNGKVLGVIGITDAVRPSSAEAIGKLKELGIQTVLMSGDVTPTATRVAREVGIERVFAEVRPEDKAAHVEELQKQGLYVAMVGDGINDAPALAQADIGIAIGAGTDVAAQAAQVILMKSDPLDIVRAIRLSKATVRKMKQNLAWASVYNLLAIPVAAGVFYSSLGWSLRPEVAALLMSVSSIIVALNAVSLRRATI
jgi:P-type E1-E2 ATPase